MTKTEWAIERMRDVIERLESEEVEIVGVNDMSDITELPPGPEDKALEHGFTGGRQLIVRYKDLKLEQAHKETLEVRDGS